MKISTNVIGISLYLMAMFVTVILNIFVKTAIKKFDLPTIEVLCCRQFIIVLFLIPIMIKHKFNFFNKQSCKPNVIRNILFSITTITLYIGISRVPLNDATAITFITPILGSVLAIKLLGEKASRMIWVALILSIIGVLIIQRPGFKDEDIVLGYGALLFTVIVRSYIVILNKRLASKFDTMTMLFYTHIVMLLITALFFMQFVPIPLCALKYIGSAGFLFFVEYYFIFKAYKYCNAITLQPFDFSRLLMMIVMSDLLLNEATNKYQIIGGLVILTGYGLIVAEKRKKKLQTNK